MLRQAGTTSILVTHDQDEALSMADQVAVLRNGVIAQIDTPAALYGHPEDAELAQFLGESNVLEGEVSDTVAATGARPAGRWRRGTGRPGAGAARVMVRPEQIVLDRGATGEVEGTVASYEYFGHDAVVRVRAGDRWPARAGRAGDRRGAARAGARVGLSVRGPVVAWPAGGRPSRRKLPNNAPVTTAVSSRRALE